MGIETASVEIPVGSGGTMGGYLARPSGGETLPAVIVYMEIFGVNAHIRSVVDRVAEEGFVALAPDYFHRTGPGIELGYDDAGMAEGMSHLGKLDAGQMIADANDTIAFLNARHDVDGSHLGAMGFCIGGHMTYLTACETGVKAAASYYGGGIAAPKGPGGGASTVSRSNKISGQLICYFGGKDAMIPQDQVATVRSALADTRGNHEVIVYDAADHGFNCDRRDSYHEESAKAAWGHTFEMFNRVLKA